MAGGRWQGEGDRRQGDTEGIVYLRIDDPLDDGSLTSLPGVLWASLWVRLGAGTRPRPSGPTGGARGRTGSSTTTPIDVAQCSVCLRGLGCWGADHHREAPTPAQARQGGQLGGLAADLGGPSGSPSGGRI